jgi:hypothetical protein
MKVNSIIIVPTGNEKVVTSYTIMSTNARSRNDHPPKRTCSGFLCLMETRKSRARYEALQSDGGRGELAV